MKVPSGADGAAASERAALAARLGQKQEAVQHYRIAVASMPKRADLRFALLRLLLETGDAAGAQAEAEALVRLKPKDAGAINLMGVALKRQGRLDEAIAQFEKAAKLDRAAHSPWINLGNIHRDSRRYGKAVAAYRRALQLAPRDSEAARLLGTSLCENDETKEGLAMLGRALAIEPRNTQALHDRAVALHRTGQFEDAGREIARALAMRPQHIPYLLVRAATEASLGRLEEARRTYETVLERAPDDVLALQRFSRHCALALGDHRKAAELLRRALSLRPGDALCAAQLCGVLNESRFDDEGALIDEAHAIAAPLVDAGTVPAEAVSDLQAVALRTADFRRAERLRPDEPLLAKWAEGQAFGSFLLQFGRVRSAEDRHALVRHQRDWGRRLSERVAHVPARAPSDPSGRKIRIGLMSSDLRDHPVCFFALPLIELYDRARFELYCYSYFPQPADKVQSHIAQRADAFRLMPEASNRQAAERIAADQLDMLFELGGPTRYNRLEVMAYRPAPVQASWLGYPHSSGIAEIDYIVVDPYLKPEDPSLLIEKPLLMAESWVSLGGFGFNEQVATIEPGLPEERSGAITFGTANNPYKLTPECIALWAGVMTQVPDSRFLFIRPEAGSAVFRKNVAAAFSEHGISAGRLEFEAVRGKHLPHYNRVDIALDTAPHTGGTTTCESLWMGVPTVTLVGPAFFERLSYTNLTNAGLPDLCARTRQEYVEIAVRLAGDRARRHELRHGLRAMIRSRPLGQVQRWVDNFFAAVEQAVIEAAQR